MARREKQPPTFIASGERNTELTSWCGYWQKRGYTDAEIREKVHALNNSACAPALNACEVDAICDSVLGRYAKGVPNSDYTHTYTAGKAKPKQVEATPAEQTALQLEALFLPDEYANIVVACKFDADREKYIPANKGKHYKVGALVEKLRETGDIEECIGEYNHSAGVWLRCNPTDGQGVADANITACRHMLVESDDMPVDVQISFLVNSGLPISTLTLSGGKSVHALVRVDADGVNHFHDIADYLFNVLADDGFRVDKANRNPSRLSRLAGVERG